MLYVYPIIYKKSSEHEELCSCTKNSPPYVGLGWKKILLIQRSYSLLNEECFYLEKSWKTILVLTQTLSFLIPFFSFFTFSQQSFLSSEIRDTNMYIKAHACTDRHGIVEHWVTKTEKRKAIENTIYKYCINIFNISKLFLTVISIYAWTFKYETTYWKEHFWSITLP